MLEKMCYGQVFFEIPTTLQVVLTHQLGRDVSSGASGKWISSREKLGDGLKIFVIFTSDSIFGEDEPILTNIFSNGLVQPPPRKSLNPPFRLTFVDCWLSELILDSVGVSRPAHGHQRLHHAKAGMVGKLSKPSPFLHFFLKNQVPPLWHSQIFVWILKGMVKLWEMYSLCSKGG